jgi:predicted HicB family RNase H-like nuclease
MDIPREKTTHTKPKMIYFRLSEELHRQLRIQVGKENLTIQDWVEQLIDKNVKPARGKQS